MPDRSAARTAAFTAVGVSLAAAAAFALIGGAVLSIAFGPWQWWVSGIVVAVTAALAWPPLDFLVEDVLRVLEFTIGPWDDLNEDPPRPWWAFVSTPLVVIVLGSAAGVLGWMWSGGATWAWAFSAVPVGLWWAYWALGVRTVMYQPRARLTGPQPRGRVGGLRWFRISGSRSRA